MNEADPCELFVSIQFGQHWKHDTEHLSHNSNTARIETIEDTLDFVVHGVNLTAPVGKEALVPFFLGLFQALCTLLDTRHKVMVPLCASPYELAIQYTCAQTFALSFYNIAHTGELTAHNVSVPQEHLVQGICRAARSLYADLVALQPTWKGAPSLQSVHKYLHLFSSEPTQKNLLSSAVPAQNTPLKTAALQNLCTLTSAADKPGELRAQLQLDLTHPDLVAYRGAPPLDLHALLCGGELVIWQRDLCWNLTDQYPVWTLRDLLHDLCRAFVLPTTFRTKHGAVLRAIDLPTNPTKISDTISLWFAPRLVQKIGARLLQPHRLPPLVVSVHTFLETITSLAFAMLERLGESNRALRQEGRLQQLRDDAKQLQAWVRASRASDAPNLNVAPKLRALAPPPSLPVDTRTDEPQSPSFRFALPAVRRLVMKPSWSWTGPLRSQDPLWLPEGLLLVTTRDSIVCIKAHQGATLWEQKHEQTHVLTLGRSLLLQGPHTLAKVHPQTGQTRWNRAAEHRYAGASLAQNTARDPRLILWDKNQVEVCSWNRGQLQWHLDFSTHHTQKRAAIHVAHNDRYLAVVSGQHVEVFSLDTGQRQWRQNTPGHAKRVWIHRDIALVLSAPQRSAPRGQAFSLETGKELWNTPLPEQPRGAPFLEDNCALWTFAHQGCAQSLQNGSVLWRCELASEGVCAPRATLFSPAPKQRGVIWKTDRGHLVAVHLRGGHLLWRQHLLEKEDDVLLSNPPVLEQARALVVATDEIQIRAREDGRLLHRLKGLPREPSWLRVTPQLDFFVLERGEPGEDVLERYEMTHFLAVVPDL